MGKRTAMILAAGEGRRLRPLTFTTPKPLVKIHGETLLHRHLRLLKRAGFDNFIVNSCWLSEKMAYAVKGYREEGYEIHNSIERSNLGTGGGIAHVLELLGELPFAVVSADVYTQVDAYLQLAENFGKLEESEEIDAIMLTVPPKFKTEGDFFQSPQGFIKPVPDTGNGEIEPTPDMTYTGMMVLHPRLFQELGRDEGLALKNVGEQPPSRVEIWADILRKVAQKGKVKGQHIDCSWADAGTHRELEKLRQSVPMNSD